jgi:hypothetical protein
MTTTPPEPAPVVPVKTSKVTLKTVLTDITVALGAAATVGEGVLVALPSGPVRTAGEVALPILLAIVVGLRKIGG